MSGIFGESPLSLEGKIADYPLTTPSTYPFSMTMTPSPKEVTWLLGKDRGDKMALLREIYSETGGQRERPINMNWKVIGIWSMLHTVMKISLPSDRGSPTGSCSAQP